MIGLLMIVGLALGEPSAVAYQLGVCSDSGCLSIGPPQPKTICQAMRDAMVADGVRRVVCARVLIDG